MMIAYFTLSAPCLGFFTWWWRRIRWIRQNFHHKKYLSSKHNDFIGFVAGMYHFYFIYVLTRFTTRGIGWNPRWPSVSTLALEINDCTMVLWCHRSAFCDIVPFWPNLLRFLSRFTICRTRFPTLVELLLISNRISFRLLSPQAFLFLCACSS